MSEPKLPTYGGQAVIEGVMMRGAKAVALAMRDPHGEIVLHTEPLGAIYQSRIVKIPFLRGLVMLWDALVLGMRTLTISANLQTGEDEQIEGPILYLTLGLSLAFSVGLFFMLPAGVGHLIGEYVEMSPWWNNLLEGGARLLLLVGYIWAVGKWDEVGRVFAYHGAEHKTINAFEAGAELTPEVVSQHSIEHPRCGTAFLLTVILFSILLFTLMGPLPLLTRLAIRVLMIPVLSSLAYEYIRWTAGHMHWAPVRWLTKPNLALQRLTTHEPTLEMIEVSIASFMEMRRLEEEYSAA